MAAKKVLTTKERKAKGLKAGIIAFGVTFAIYALLPIPLYRIGDYILAAAVSLLVAKVVSLMAQGPDLRPIEEKVKEKEPLPVTGNAATDELMKKGQEMLVAIRQENLLIPDEALSRKMDELDDLIVKIFKTVADKPQKAPQIRRFMDYYLPTTLKMLKSFRLMDERQVTGQEAQKVRRQIDEALDVVVTACEKQLNNLYRDEYLDISTDIDVLQQMLRRDGLMETDFTPLNTQAKAQAQAQTQTQQTEGGQPQ